MSRNARLTEQEKAAIRTLFAKTTTAEIARKIGRHENTVRSFCKQEGLKHPEPPTKEEIEVYTVPVDGEDEKTHLERLEQLANMLESYILNAPPTFIAQISKEYRATLEDIARLKGEQDGGGEQAEPFAAVIKSLMD